MSIIEVLLRLGCGLVAWLVVYTHCIWTATLFVTGCDSDGDSLWRLLLGFAPFTVGFCLLLNITSKLVEVHRILVWASAPLLLFVPLALRAIWPTFTGATLEGGGICGVSPVPDWHLWWAPVQFGVMAVIVGAAARSWMLNRRIETSRGAA